MPRPRLMAVILLAVVSTACSPLPFGPGRITVDLDDVRVEKTTRGTLSEGQVSAQYADDVLYVVRFDFSSETNLFTYFKDWNRLVQARCYVTGARDGRSYSAFASGPIQDGIDISYLGLRRTNAAHLPPRKDGRFAYTIFAFQNLSANDDEYKYGKPVGNLDLSKQHFEQLSCYVIGVTKAPVLFPRSNDLILSEARFRELLSQAPRQ